MLSPISNRRGNGNCGCGGNESALLRKLQAVDFALYDTVLYLDAYPNCRKALSYYHSLLEAQKKLQTEYEAKYGPVTAFGNASADEWKWTLTPWPWELH